MSFLAVTLVLAALLCGLASGLAFTFAVVVMPGIRSFSDADFLRSFQAMDRVIQEGQPLFMVVWLGSIVVVLAGLVAGFMTLDGVDLLLLTGSAIGYLAFFQLPTFVVNVPMNNRLQALEVNSLNEAELRSTRASFEPRWNRWNQIRTFFGCLCTLGLLAALVRL